MRRRRAAKRAPPPATIRTPAPPISHGVASAPVCASELEGASDAVSFEVGVPEADCAGVPSSLPGLSGEGLPLGFSLGLSVGFSVDGGVVAVLALVTVTVTGSPGLALNAFEGL